MSRLVDETPRVPRRRPLALQDWRAWNCACAGCEDIVQAEWARAYPNVSYGTTPAPPEQTPDEELPASWLALCQDETP